MINNNFLLASFIFIKLNKILIKILNDFYNVVRSKELDLDVKFSSFISLIFSFIFSYIFSFSNNISKFFVTYFRII